MLDHEGKEVPGNRGYKYVSLHTFSFVLCALRKCLFLCVCIMPIIVGYMQVFWSCSRFAGSEGAL